jgi:cytochrome bd-type quinol oxidase subunit 2
MIKKLKSKLMGLAALFVLAVPVAVPVAVGAQNVSGNLCSGSNLDISGNGTSNNCPDQSSTLGDKIKTIINIFSAVVGAVAVIMIIVGGFRYITSAGNETNVKAARTTILYAVVGLVIVALAQLIVHFVIHTAGP